MCIVGVSVAGAATFRKPIARKPSIDQVLAGIGTKLKADFKAGMTPGVFLAAAPHWSVDILMCAETIRNGMDDLKASYSGVQVPIVLHQACDFSNVYLNLGKNKQACANITATLSSEFEGDQNYHRWCRNVAASESDAMKEAAAMLEKDPEAIKLLGECAEQCPYIAKIIKTSAASMGLQNKMRELMRQPPVGTMEENTAKFKKIMSNVGTLGNRVCDLKAKAKCTLQNMHASCGKMFEKIQLPKPVLAQGFTMCDAKMPCAKVCHGVTEKQTAFQTASMTAMMGGAKEKLDQCKALSVLEPCTKQDACIKYFAGGMPMNLDPVRKMCEVVTRPCYAKIEKVCSKPASEFNGPTLSGGQSCPDKISWSDFEPLAEADTKECCGKFGKLGECARKLGCADTFLDDLKMTRGTDPHGVQTNCPAQWSATFK